MEEVYFVLGMVAILVVLGILAIVTVKKKIEELEEEFQFHERNSHDVAVDMHRRIDDEVRELKTQLKEATRLIQDTQIQIHHTIDNEVRMLQSNIDENERDIISLLDSQVDRLTSKIKQQLPKG